MLDVPLGIQDFKKIRDGNYYYVDKSRLICDILDRNAEVYLFTRPRRFGKSLNLSMLDAYLNQRYAGNTWFDGLSVSASRQDDPDKNSNPVIYLDMKDLGDGTFGQFVYALRWKMIRLFIDLLELDVGFMEQSDVFPSMDTDEGIARMMSSLKDLSHELHIRTGRKAVILIDEYDNAVNNALTGPSAWEGSNGRTDRRLILDFLRGFLGSVLKGNEDMRFAVLTGIMRVGKDSIFSGLNNLVTDSVFWTMTDESFGFTESEIIRICNDYGRPEKYAELKEWYDGYNFGEADVYNPWSVMNYVFYGFRPRTYWAGTSGNDIIDTLLENMDGSIYSRFIRLAAKGHISQYIDESMGYSDLMKDRNSIFTIMAMSGYLSSKAEAEPGYYSLSIPNREMDVVFRNMFLNRISVTGDRIRMLENAVMGGNSGDVAEALGGFVMSIDPKVMSHEHAYEILCIALLMHLEGPYEVTNEIHTGKGYCDILLKSNRPDFPNVLMELKRKRDDRQDLDDLADAVLGQIHDLMYTHGLKGPTHLYGIAFDGCDVSVRHETEDL